MGVRYGILKEIPHQEWEPKEGTLDAGRSIDTTKVSKIIQYLKFTFIEFKIGKAKKNYNGFDGPVYIYEYPQLRRKWKNEINLKDDQDLIIDPNAGQTVQIGKKFDNKTVIEIYSKRKTDSVKQIIQNGEGKGKRVVYSGEEDLDRYIFIRFADRSIIKIKRDRIASLKKIK
jgi:hypothetical protein